ncbi:uncharacterized protein LOC113342780 isoform X1 [Papaver somniferum]|uniref:uncharacterized protein LOC113342780 isoform X1 n=1 Tax=Papaver somniferum TaxID=3469 RepID=UPI000E7031F9|nr:uncharacterized protein LOC113342780 isoform X1 [Papaver somniferum]
MFRLVTVDDPDVSNDDNQTEENSSNENPETSDMSESDEVVKYELGIDGNQSELPSSSSYEMPNWIRQMLDSAAEFDPSSVDAFEQMQMLHNLSQATDELEFDGTQWSPSEEQTRILEMLYNGGISGVRSPTVQEIEQITSQLINYGKVEVTDVYLWFQARKDPGRQKQTLRLLSPTGMEGLEITEPPTSPEISNRGGKGKAVPVEERSGLEEVVDMSSKMFGQKEGSDNSRVTYDSTGKLLPINSEKQWELIPLVEENIDVRANIIFLDRDFLEEPDPHIPSQRDPSLPTVSSSTSSNREEESRPEGQNNIKTADAKKRRWFNLFPWWQKK